MPMAHGLPFLPSGVVLDGTEAFWVDKFINGEWQTYQVSLDQIVILASGVQLGDVNIFTKNQSVAPVSLVDGANVAVDASLSNNFTWTIGGSNQLDNPTGLTDGMVLSFVITEDGTGGWTPAFGTMYKFDSAAAPAWDTAAGAVNYLSAQYDAGNNILICGALVGLG